MNVAETACLALLLLQQVSLQFAGRICRYNYYYSLKIKDCKLCRPCIPGQKMQRNCGIDSAGRRVSPACEWCPRGTYGRLNGYEGLYDCNKCIDCTAANRKIVEFCSATKDAVCGGCLNGFQRADGGCKKIMSPSTKSEAPITKAAIRTDKATTTAQLTDVKTIILSTKLPTSQSRVHSTTTVIRKVSTRTIIPTSQMETRQASTLTQPYSNFTRNAKHSRAATFLPLIKSDRPVIVPRRDDQNKKRTLKEHFTLIAIVGAGLILIFVGVVAIGTKKRRSRKKTENTNVDGSCCDGRLVADNEPFKEEKYFEDRAEYSNGGLPNTAVPMDAKAWVGSTEECTAEPRNTQRKCFRQASAENTLMLNGLQRKRDQMPSTERINCKTNIEEFSERQRASLMREKLDLEIKLTFGAHQSHQVSSL